MEKSGAMAAAGAVHPQSWCSVQCTGIYAREIMSNTASCKQASSTAMMIVTADSEADLCYAEHGAYTQVSSPAQGLVTSLRGAACNNLTNG